MNQKPEGSLPDFSNTAIAFQARSDSDLWRARMLFETLDKPLVQKAGTHLMGAALKLHLPVSFVVKKTIFAHFCGGETVDEALVTAEGLARYCVRSIVDYSVEGLTTDAEFDHTRDEVLAVIAKAKQLSYLSFAVFKFTGMGRLGLWEKVSAGTALSAEERQEFERVRGRFHTICQAAEAAGVRLLVDAEETWLQQAVDDLLLEMMRQYNRNRPVVYNTLQMYRHDRVAFLKNLIATAKSEGFRPGIKLVRGAYMEKERERAAATGAPDPIQPDKDATDRDYDEALKICISEISRVGLFSGTHNENSNLYLVRLMREAGLSPGDERVEFSQLYGMSDNQTFNLAHHGYHASKYLPYGPVRSVLPYLLRRATENTSVQGQAGRELQMIRREMARRSKDGRGQMSSQVSQRT